MVYDVKDVGDGGKVKADGRTVYLNEQDDLWVRFRYKHIAEVTEKVKTEVQNVIEDSKKGKNVKNDMDLAQMADLVREMPKIQELMKNY